MARQTPRGANGRPAAGRSGSRSSYARVEEIATGGIGRAAARRARAGRARRLRRRGRGVREVPAARSSGLRAERRALRARRDRSRARRGRGRGARAPAALGRRRRVRAGSRPSSSGFCRSVSTVSRSGTRVTGRVRSSGCAGWRASTSCSRPAAATSTATSGPAIEIGRGRAGGLHIGRPVYDALTARLAARRGARELTLAGAESNLGRPS